MTTFFDSFEKFADLSRQGVEPVRHLSNAYVDAFEKITRKQYAFAGDMVEFAVSQARLPLEVSEPREFFERQIEATKAFAELCTARANEYVELGNELRENTASLIDKDFIEPVTEAAKAAAEQAA